MSCLKYKTRGMSTYRGKAGVYFVCHPDDFELYFETISEEILEKQNVAIWYEDFSAEQTGGADERLHDLSEMNLFVVAVTDRFITGENEKVKADMEFAMERNIPILPLLQESGLEKAFSEKYDNLQVLDKNKKDLTALSYEEKFTKFLESVLVGDELLERVRKDFVARIFVSYRKKDREYAQRFMQTLHADITCRDIGIWYDEFLTIGRNFDESIKNALENCDLFVLIVTPNLNEEKNYVKRIEYPAAVERNKPIVPIVFVYTDRDELEQNYPGIPECINVPYAEMTKILVERWRNMAGENCGVGKYGTEWTLEHCYLMGLAYLYGIDVEQSIFKARSLLEAAAEAGLKEATEKLVGMWYNGIGVNRNLRIACDWQALLVHQCYGEYYYDNVESTLKYIEETVKLADMQVELGELYEARKLYEDIIIFQDDFWDRCGILSNHYRQACLGLMNIYLQEGNEERAKDCAEAAVMCSGILYKEAKDIPSLIRLVKDYSNRAYIYKLQGNIQEARSNIIVALQHVEEARQMEDSTRIDMLWTGTMVLAGEINLKAGIDAKVLFEEALPVAKRVAEEVKNIEAYLNLIGCYGDLGDIAADEGLVLKAGDYYNDGLAICEKLVKATESPVAYDALGYMYYRLATCNKGSVIIFLLRKALATYEFLTDKYPSDTVYREKYRLLKELEEEIP